MTAPTFPSPPLARPTPRWLRIVSPLATIVAPATLSLLVLRYLLPSRFEGTRGGVLGFLAWLGDTYPLFLGVGLFLVFSEVARYWGRRLSDSETKAQAETPAAAASDAARPGGRIGRQQLRLVFGLLSLGAVVFILRTSVVATFRVVGPSMLPTLEIGDRVLTNRLAYGLQLPFGKTLAFRKTPQRGDLVVFRAEGLAGPDGPQALVKRVIGVPGDRVSFDQTSVYINDWRVPTCDAGPYAALAGKVMVKGRLTVEYLGDRSYLIVRKPLDTAFAGYIVKPGEVFVVGDDRGISSDSRLWNEGRGAGVSIDALQGRVSQVLLGARLDGRLDFSRILAPPLDLKVRMPGIDMSKADERIRNCLAKRPANTTPPPGHYPTS